MMRANLLPRPKETFSLFGLAVAADVMRQALLGIAIVTCVALLGIAFESLRIHRVEAAAISEESALADRVLERDEARDLALDVARYQEIGREEDSVRRSGAAAAVTIARIGNAVPGGVWLDSLNRDTNGFELTGASTSVDAIGGTIADLAGALPGKPAALVSIDNRDNFAGLHFTARISAPPASASSGDTSVSPSTAPTGRPQ